MLDEGEDILFVFTMLVPYFEVKWKDNGLDWDMKNKRKYFDIYVFNI